MKNLPKVLLILITINFQLSGMQPPARQPEEASFNSLPLEIKRLLIPLIASSKVQEVAKTILALNHTNQFLRTVIRSEAGLISILEQMPYTANAIDLVELLQAKAPMASVAQSDAILVWTKKAKEQLRNGRRLFSVVGRTDNLEELELLLKDKLLDLNYRAENAREIFPIPNGSTPLMAAAKEAKLAMLEKLLAAGANPHILYNEGGRIGASALYFASMLGKNKDLSMKNKKLAIIAKLLASGANPNQRITNNDTAIMYAIYYDFPEATKALLAAGADPNLKSTDGNSALMAAAFKGNIDIAKTLLDSGANPDIENAQGQTAYHIASIAGHQQLAKLLEETSIAYKAKQAKK